MDRDCPGAASCPQPRRVGVPQAGAYAPLALGLRGPKRLDPLGRGKSERAMQSAWGRRGGRADLLVSKSSTSGVRFMVPRQKMRPPRPVSIGTAANRFCLWGLPRRLRPPPISCPITLPFVTRPRSTASTGDRGRPGAASRPPGPAASGCCPAATLFHVTPLVRALIGTR